MGKLTFNRVSIPTLLIQQSIPSVETRTSSAIPSYTPFSVGLDQCLFADRARRMSRQLNTYPFGAETATRTFQHYNICSLSMPDRSMFQGNDADYGVLTVKQPIIH